MVVLFLATSRRALAEHEDGAAAVHQHSSSPPRRLLHFYSEPHVRQCGERLLSTTLSFARWTLFSNAACPCPCPFALHTRTKVTYFQLHGHPAISIAIAQGRRPRSRDRGLNQTDCGIRTASCSCSCIDIVKITDDDCLPVGILSPRLAALRMPSCRDAIRSSTQASLS